MGGFGKVIRSLADSFTNRRERSHALAFLAGMRKDVRRAFDSSTDPVTGKKWAPLKYRVGQILVDTGRMRAAALRVVDKATADGKGVTLELTDPPYSAVHQFGNKRVPQRRFFAASPETQRSAGVQWADEIVKVSFKKGGTP